MRNNTRIHNLSRETEKKKKKENTGGTGGKETEAVGQYMHAGMTNVELGMTPLRPPPTRSWPWQQQAVVIARTQQKGKTVLGEGEEGKQSNDVYQQEAAGERKTRQSLLLRLLPGREKERESHTALRAGAKTVTLWSLLGICSRRRWNSGIAGGSTATRGTSTTLVWAPGPRSRLPGWSPVSI